MSMKKLIIFALLLISINMVASAETYNVLLEFHRRTNSNNTKVDRAPMRLPIDVVYDSDASTIEVTSSLTQEPEVYIYDTNGSIVGYSQTLNTSILLVNVVPFIIHIVGNDWYAIGEILYSGNNHTIQTTI